MKEKAICYIAGGYEKRKIIGPSIYLHHPKFTHITDYLMRNKITPD
jgi:hypothetical protein